MTRPVRGAAAVEEASKIDQHGPRRHSTLSDLVRRRLPLLGPFVAGRERQSER
jgi:hypothetical protein